MELDEKTYGRILKKCNAGDALMDKGKYKKALAEYEAALKLLPEPVYIWEAATWIYTALGDAYFYLADYSKGLDYFMEAQKCADGLGNPFILARIGECFFETGNMEKAKEYLIQAYALEGQEIFSDVDEKYFKLIEDMT